MLDVKDLTLHYGNSQILYDISMHAKLGEVTCVMGTNGVGKTSLLRAISGTHIRSGGSISLGGKPLGQIGAHKIAHMGVGYVPQGRDIFPLLTVRENLQTGFSCLPNSEHFIPNDIYELFPVLEEMAHRRGGRFVWGTAATAGHRPCPYYQAKITAVG
ncbi:MAG: ATP-binding cassette domain-containing protein [Sulfitobacter sp. SK025]|nr:MAG: ATP-binding cassette domain-containing protein [Sulfitobacter sp. SK025]